MTSCSCRSRPSAPPSPPVTRFERGREHEVGQRHLRAGVGHDRRRQRGARPTRRSCSTSDPYGDGWICEIEIERPGELEALLDAAGYQALVEGESRPMAARVLQPVRASQPGRRALLLVVRRAARSAAGPHGHHRQGRSAAGRARRGRRRRRRPRRRCPRASASLVVRSGPQAGAARSPLERPASPGSAAIPTARSCLDDITVSRRHAEIERTADGLRGARRRLAERHLRQPRADRRRDRRSPTVTSCRSASSASCSSIGAGQTDVTRTSTASGRTCRSARCSGCCSRSSPTSRSRRSGSSRARA